MFPLMYILFINEQWVRYIGTFCQHLSDIGIFNSSKQEMNYKCNTLPSFVLTVNHLNSLKICYRAAYKYVCLKKERSHFKMNIHVLVYYWNHSRCIFCLYILKRINKKQDQWLLFKFLLESGLFSMQYWHHNHT